jgi:hypothetical protein
MWNLFHSILHIEDISKQAVSYPPSNIPTLNFAKNAKFRMGHPRLGLDMFGGVGVLRLRRGFTS